MNWSASMLDGFTDERRDPQDDARHWRALEEVGAIVRAVLLAATALAIGWLVSASIDIPDTRSATRVHVTAI